MAFQLIEAIVPKERAPDFTGRGDESPPPIGVWTSAVDEERVAVRVLVPVEQTEEVIEWLEEQCHDCADYRLMLFTIDATLPRPQEPESSDGNGNGSNNDACLNNCAANVCGDSFVNAGVEACDDGNASNRDNCVVSLEGVPCQIAICGPVLDVLLGVTGDFEDVRCLHAEVYAHPEEDTDTKAPVIDALGLTFEPCLVLVGSDGTVAERLDTIYDTAEVVEALSRLV